VFARSDEVLCCWESVKAEQADGTRKQLGTGSDSKHASGHSKTELLLLTAILESTLGTGKYCQSFVVRRSEVLFEELRDARSDRVTGRTYHVVVNVPIGLSARSLCMIAMPR